MAAQTRQADGDAPHLLAQLGTHLVARSHAVRTAPIGDAIIRVIVVDDHTLVREGLRVLLQEAPDIGVVGEAESGVAALELVRRVMPDVVLLDLDMPGGDGESVLSEMLRQQPPLRVLVLTMHPEQARLVSLLGGGARGYLTKEAASRELVEAIRAVAAGEVYVRPVVARLLAGAMASKGAAVSARDRFRTLSDREATVLRLVAEGYSGAEIARQLGVSTKTVDAYKHRIHDKVGLQHRTEYVRFAIEAQILGS
jgi:DNA-binding NarL/FixJ family response regulator